MLAAIKHVAGDNVVFQQDSTPACCTRNTFFGDTMYRAASRYCASGLKCVVWLMESEAGDARRH